MSTLTALARAHAVTLGRAQPITTVRHLHVSAVPLVCVPLAMAGEANAPLAAMLGTNVGAPALLVVPQPRNRDQRFEFAQALASVMLGYFDAAAECGLGAPQVWVPNGAGVEFLRLLGRSTRFRETSGPHAVPASVPVLGMWLTFLAGRAEIPGSSIMVAATDALSRHWATGQSSIEDANLAALLSWIVPPAGSSGAEAALAAADPLLCPPAGPATDPTFDREVLEPGIAEYDHAAGDPERQRALVRLETALRGQLEPTWRLMWRAIEELGALEAGGHVGTRWERDTKSFIGFRERVADGARPQPKRDGAVAAAERLNRLERDQARYDAQRAFDDPLVMAEHRLAGDAFAGTVVAADPTRRAGEGRRTVLRPTITVSTSDPVRLVEDDDRLVNVHPRKHKAAILAIAGHADGVDITLELRSGMGRGKEPEPGSVPGLGDRVCFSIVTDQGFPEGAYPDPESTPWTHGGPPVPPKPPTNDAAEDWS